MVERPLSSARPSWFEITSPSTPCSTASAASSPVTIPFRKSFILGVELRRFAPADEAALQRLHEPIAHVVTAAHRSLFEAETGGILYRISWGVALFADQLEGSGQDVVGEVHAGIPKCLEYGARTLDPPTLLTEQDQSQRTSNVEPECSGTSSSREVIDNDFAAGIQLAPGEY